MYADMEFAESVAIESTPDVAIVLMDIMMPEMDGYQTMELIRRNYEFPKMKDKVTSFIAKCADCQKNKHSTHAPYREMQAMELPKAPWSDISIDFVTGLLVSRDPVTQVLYNAILVVVD